MISHKYQYQTGFLLIHILKLSFVFLLIGCNSDNNNEVIKEFNVKKHLASETNHLYIIDKIIDGDTYRILIKNNKYNVRLIGIDTPEASNNFKTRADAKRESRDISEIIAMGKIATDFVTNFINKGDSVKLELDVQHIDKYNRILAYVYLMDGRMMNEILVREGYANVMTVPPNVKFQNLFLEAQIEARENQRGLWSDTLTIK